MRRLAFDPRDVIGGLLLLALGVATVIGGEEYAIGTARRMGPGYFPVLLGYICAALGLAVIAKGFIRRLWDEGEMQLPSVRAILGITGSVAAFILAGQHLGLVPAILALVVIGGFVDRGNTPRSIILLAIGVAAGGVALFSYALGIVFRLFPWSY
ncbi:tripartite tricarboxylate transporter TctB family protein [Roseomonas sp. SSH11]|uniref:Tripartite tricarboxylate transporter TctB family protein n=1 Tax=Pararoseomonas baculiformis TaxID=2820812 RepID=A0ABS4AEF8_9PROT|nr:tripartite tricarboxylate transporter TctB family protein [Pararoseomonas baculiformis]MBP0445379.1 tripartite tricarboxylate transporter TctB family protein [Pararoseomonas baculiformis]